MKNMNKEPKYLNEVRSMPKLSHWPGKEDGEKWNPESSEVLKWMLMNECLMNWLLSHFAKSGVIRYDKTDGKWCGVPKSVEVDSAHVPAEQVEYDPNRIGRPSVIDSLLELYHRDLLEEIASKANGYRAAGRLIQTWSAKSGKEICESTARRLAFTLVQRRELKKTESGFSLITSDTASTSTTDMPTPNNP